MKCLFLLLSFFSSASVFAQGFIGTGSVYKNKYFIMANNEKDFKKAVDADYVRYRWTGQLSRTLVGELDPILGKGGLIVFSFKVVHGKSLIYENNIEAPITKKIAELRNKYGMTHLVFSNTYLQHLLPVGPKAQSMSNLARVLGIKGPYMAFNEILNN